MKFESDDVVDAQLVEFSNQVSHAYDKLMQVTNPQPTTRALNLMPHF